MKRICKFPGCKNVAYEKPEEPRDLCDEHFKLAIGLVDNCYICEDGLHTKKHFIPYENIDKLYSNYTKWVWISPPFFSGEDLRFEIVDRFGNKIKIKETVPDYVLWLWDIIISKVADRQYAELVDFLEKQGKTMKVDRATISRTSISFKNDTYKFEEILDLLIEDGVLYALVEGVKKTKKLSICGIAGTANVHALFPYLHNKVKHGS
jgi:hypothetical protein